MENGQIRNMSSSESNAPAFDASVITRPDAMLLWYYVVLSLLTGPAFPIAFLPLLCKYVTLRYRFDESGIAMSWGVLFRREIHLTYRRIQDIHLTRNLLQRWMGLATVAIQTASGSAGPEMSIEGVLEADRLRDYLYGEMRGAREGAEAHGTGDESAESGADPVLTVLCEIRDLLQRSAQLREKEA
jgi:uncharacterized membrane protein YdbT with pleckstrin-like domain